MGVGNCRRSPLGALTLGSLLIATLSSNGCAHQRWAIRTLGLLECGMTLEEIEAIASRSSVGRGHPALGDNRIERGSTDVWLSMPDGRLESAIVLQIGGYLGLSYRLSPRRNYCTGAETFELHVILPPELLGSSILVDGEEARFSSVEKGPDDRIVLIPVGDHELRIETPGYQPITFRLHYESGVMAEPRLFVGSDKVVPSGSPSP